jgi:hypothetical protein
MTKRFLLVITFLLAATGAAFAGDDAPAWLRQVATATTPTYPKDVPAVVLLDDERVTVTDDGKVVTVQQYAVRILTREGREEAFARAYYRSDDSIKVKDFKAWVIRPNGVRKFNKDEIADVALTDNDVYAEGRMKLIVAEDEVDAGMVFGFEAVTEERSVFTQFIHSFQVDIPVLVSRFSLTLPTGWRAEGLTFNHAKIEPTVSGSSYTWELRELGPIYPEPDQPAKTTLAPRVAVGYFPAAGAKAGEGQSFGSWPEVSDWLYGLSDSQAAPTQPLTTKARELTAGVNDEFARLSAIGRYVQGVNYISIQTNIRKGGGYRPHAAGQVFEKSYGDCKDKANLMRAMLKTIGVNSYLVSIYSGDRAFVRKEWASPQQFNHCIIAIQVGDSVQSPMVVKHPKLGRLLFFDPTDPFTPIGDLPEDEQGSFALVIAGKDGDLIQVPQNPPESNLDNVMLEAEVLPDGSVKAKMSNEMTGQMGSRFRGLHKSLSAADFQKYVNRWLTRSATGLQIGGVMVKDQRDQGRFTLEVDLAVPNYAPLMQGRLMMISPSLIPRRAQVSVAQPNRRTPIEIDAEAYTEIFRFKIPAGFEVDEIPEPVSLESAYGTYSMKCEAKDREVVVTRKLKLIPAVIPAESYGSVRRFFGQIGGAEQTPIVLVKK